MRVFSFTCLLSCWLVAVPQAASLNKIAAVVNGEMITSFDLDAQTEPHLRRLKLDPQDSRNATQIAQLRRTVLDNMVNTIIMTQEAERLKITVEEKEVDQELNQFLQRNNLTPETFQRQLQLQGLTEKAFRDRIRSSILRNRLLSNMVGRKVVVTKDEIIDYYDRHREMLTRNESAHFAIIIYPPTVEAEKYASQILSGTVSFEQMARNISVGPRAKEGGDVGTVAWSALEPKLQNQLSVLKQDEISPLFDLNGLKGQLKLIDMTSDGELTLEEATPQIEEILREPKLQERFQEYYEQIRKRAVIEIR